MIANLPDRDLIGQEGERQVTLTDFVFTAGGSGLVMTAGLTNVYLHGIDLFATRWLFWGFWIFVLSGVIWVAILIPIQYQQAKLAREFARGGTIPDRYWRLNRQWYIWGILDTLIPFSVIYWMVFKPS